MEKTAEKRAYTCQFNLLRVIAIMASMIGCGGAIAPTAADNGDTKGSSSCPSGSCAGDEDAGAWSTNDDAGSQSTTTVDARADAMRCVSADPSGFNQTCTQDTDCVAVAVGNICNTGSCLCAAGALNVSDQQAYQDHLNQLLAMVSTPQAGCGCPFFGTAKCINDMCQTCGGAGPTCPDGG